MELKQFTSLSRTHHTHTVGKHYYILNTQLYTCMFSFMHIRMPSSKYYTCMYMYTTYYCRRQSTPQHTSRLLTLQESAGNKPAIALLPPIEGTSTFCQIWSKLGQTMDPCVCVCVCVRSARSVHRQTRIPASISACTMR
jgi:hypothetical protein